MHSGTETISLRLRANRNTDFFWGTVPQFWGRGGVGGWVWYPMKACHNRHNVSVGTVTLSVDEQEA